eukprot:13847823-Alexandrium_andersonii.AAC.1
MFSCAAYGSRMCQDSALRNDGGCGREEGGIAKPSAIRAMMLSCATQALIPVSHPARTAHSTFVDGLGANAMRWKPCCCER